MLHIDLADQHHHGSSLIHRLDPRVKVIGTLLFILAASLAPAGAWLGYALLFAGTLVVAHLTGLGTGFALRRSYVALPFALAAIALPFTVAGTALAQVGPWSISVEGTVRLLSILVKSWLSVQAAILMTNTTAFPDLMWGLRALRVPAALVAIVGFMYRYLFVLADEGLRLRRARAARSGAGPAGAKTGGGLMWRGQVAGGMVGNLTLRAFERSERIHAAMVARGYQGEMHMLDTPHMHDQDWNALVGWVTFLTLAALVGFIFG
ncbi:MAG: cobalt ECF transporter T component CbiQ [Anaerolineales bacterium]|nr:cobalt ECF transporter T component CbiQ [Anaerolineales bacterium]